MNERYVLRLYVAGPLPASARAVEAVRGLCDQYLRNRYELQVIDVYQQPQLALDAQVDVVPILLKCSPAPVRRILGDFSERERVLLGLDLQPSAHEETPRLSKRP